MSKLQISDLFNVLTHNQSLTLKDGPIQSQKLSKATEQFLVQGNMKVKKINKAQQVKMKRELNYRKTQEDMDKWLGIVKINREKQSLNFTIHDRQTSKINFFPAKPVSQLQAKTDKILSQLSMKNQSDIIKMEQKQLNKIDPQQAKRRLIEARKHRTMIFYQEIKQRRISKIKSKLYHKIKKRQKLREEQKKYQTISSHEKSQYLEKLVKNRIKERISLRHNTKNKHIQNLLRFNKFNKDSVQQAINEVNQIRQKQLQKNKIDEEILENLSQEYDDENYRQQAMIDLEKQLEQIEQQNPVNGQENKAKGLDSMKFMKVAKEKQVQKDIEDAYKLINKLECEEDSREIVLDSDEGDEEEVKSYNKSKKKINSHNNENQGQISRKTYGNDNLLTYQRNAKTSNQPKQFIKKNIQQSLSSNIENLTKGLNLQNLKDKYQPQRVNLKLNEQLLEMNRNIFNNNQAVLQNLKEFQQDKQLNFEQDIQPEKKKLKGWGNWTGPNIKEKAVDPQLQIKKKLAKIQEIKRKRKDGELTNVIVTEVRNKQLKDYMVRKLPHEFTSLEQFDYLNQPEIGPEWNSLIQYKMNIKPKVITKVGQVIEPIKLPRKMAQG